MKLFKVSTLIAISVASLFNGPTATCAKKFVPTSFVQRTNLLDTPQRVETLTQTASLSKRGGSAVAVKPSARTLWSYYSDMMITVLIGGFTCLWFKSLAANNKDELGIGFPFFEKSFLANGFCNKVYENPGTGGPLTQKFCFYADCVMVIASYFLAKSRGKETNLGYISMAIYTIIHGVIHYSVFRIPNVATGPLTVVGTVMLSFVMILCPMALYSVLTVAPQTKNKGVALPISAVTWLVSVAVYYFTFKKKDYALPYINVSVFLVMYSAKTILLGLKDDDQIAARDAFDANFFKNYGLGQLATYFVIVILICEPIYCGSWFGNAGGHLLFDIALYTFLMVAALG